MDGLGKQLAQGNWKIQAGNRKRCRKKTGMASKIGTEKGGEPERSPPKKTSFSTSRLLKNCSTDQCFSSTPSGAYWWPSGNCDPIEQEDITNTSEIQIPVPFPVRVCLSGLLATWSMRQIIFLEVEDYVPHHNDLRGNFLRRNTRRSWWWPETTKELCQRIFSS